MERGSRVLVLGSSGLLGSELLFLLKKREIPVIGFSRADLDITDPQASLKKIVEVEPELVINCAAYTKVDKAEDEPELAFLVNRDGARNVARAAKEAGAKIVYISTDYVFDGRKNTPYREDDEINPLSIYGRSKAEGERAVMEENEDHLIVRTSWLYGRKEPNFVLTILKKAREESSLRVVADQVGAPTYVYDLAYGIVSLVEKNASGIYHFTNSGEVSWYGFALKIVELAGINGLNIIPITTEEAGRKAIRPKYSVLDLTKTSHLLGDRPRRFEEALAEFLNSYQKKRGEVSC